MATGGAESTRYEGAEEMLLAHLPVIDAIVAFIARRHHLRAADADEFRSLVRLKLVENDYAVLRKYQGHSSIRTYLTTVIQRLFLDERVRAWGRWRPSAAARRSGPIAVLFERLIVRDRRSFDEACTLLEEQHHASQDRAKLMDLYEQLPHRPRPRIVDSEFALGAAAAGTTEDGVIETEQTATAARTADALRRAVATLEPQDRLIVRLRFEEGLTVAQIARATSQDQKALYRRFEQLTRGLRSALEAEGIHWHDVADLLGRPHIELDGIFSAAGPENPIRARLNTEAAAQTKEDL